MSDDYLRTLDPFLVEVSIGLATTFLFGHATPMAIATDISLHLITHAPMERLLYPITGRVRRIAVRAIGLGLVTAVSLLM